jgi:hypothetical protein
MSTVKEVSKMYDALLSLDVLDEPVKLDIRVPCRLTLLLALAVEQGLAGNDPGNFFKKVVSEEDQKKLLELTAEILKKGKLEGFYQKLKDLGQG